MYQRPPGEKDRQGAEKVREGDRGVVAVVSVEEVGDLVVVRAEPDEGGEVDVPQKTDGYVTGKHQVIVEFDIPTDDDRPVRE